MAQSATVLLLWTALVLGLSLPLAEGQGRLEQQQAAADAQSPPAGSRGAPRVHANSRQLQQQRQSAASAGPPPGDPTAGDLLLWLLHEEDAAPLPAVDAAAARAAPASRSSGQQAAVTLRILFQALAEPGVSLRLPPPPRGLSVEVWLAGGGTQGPACHATSLPYREQELSCNNLREGELYDVLVVDSDDDALQLASLMVNATDGLQLPVVVRLGMLVLEASFGSLAWAGSYASHMAPPDSPLPIHAQIVGAMITVFSRTSPDLAWDTQWTGDQGSAVFFIIPGSHDFVANMSVGQEVLNTSPIEWRSDVPLLHSQLVELQAGPQILCTGEVEQVRGASGSFPAPLSTDKGRGVYHPKGFFCRWELLPDNPDLQLTVSYGSLLPDESLTLYLGPEDVVRLAPPTNGAQGVALHTSVVVERSVFVEFQTSRRSTHEVGGFSIKFTSSGPGPAGGLGSKALVVVLASVSAAGAVLAALCFYCVCCSRRRRTAVVMDEPRGAPTELRLLRVPSEVRGLLPSKPYRPPPCNPLPGADGEADCCSICLVELEPGEQLTVLPCMHFYHRDCIDSWLKRNCTCPLCKSNVLEAFKRTQHRSRHQHQHHHQQQQQQLAATEGTAEDGSGSSGSDGSFSVAAPGVIVAPWEAAAGSTPVRTRHSSVHDAAGGSSAPLPSVRPLLLPPLPGTGSAAGLAAAPGWPPQTEAAAAAAAAAAHGHHHACSSSRGRQAQPAEAAAAVAAAGEPAVSGERLFVRQPSSLQHGSVFASASDFAAAAAAAAAAASESPEPAVSAPDEQQAPATGPLQGLLTAAHAPVRLLQQLMAGGGGAGTTAVTAAAAGGGGGPAAGGGEPPALAEAPGQGRAAVSLYVYAAEPAAMPGADQEQQGVELPVITAPAAGRPGDAEEV